MFNLSDKKSMVVNASLLRRVLAFLLDLLVIDLVIMIPFRGLLEKLVPEGGLSETIGYLSRSSGQAMLYAITLTITILAILYFVILEKKLGQTPGKILFSLYVVPVDKKESLWRYFLRSIFLIPVFPFILLWIVDPMYALFNEQHQRLTEYVSKTKVVEKISW